MNNGLGQPQSIVLVGGTSDIGLAIVRELLNANTHTVVLACRDVARGEQAAGELRREGLRVDVVPFDGADSGSHQGFADSLAADYGDIDVVVLAFALLGDPATTTTNAAAAAEVAQVNFTGTVSATVALANVLRAQGHGAIVMLSSVAGERVRKANPVYGGTKAGIDGFAQGLGDSLAADGVHMLIVRPGFVHSQMTKGLKAAPMATTPEVVAKITASALRAKKRMVWAPPKLRPVFSVLRHVPAPLWRRLPLG
jgi:decaprenylphospho-beta-D-erythro-pentofuranosid-2-ulose 2-reductase